MNTIPNDRTRRSKSTTRPCRRPVKHNPLSEMSCRGIPVTGGGLLEAGPLGSVVGLRTALRQEEPGVIIQGVHHGPVGECDLGGVDLPQVVGDLPLEALGGLGSFPGLVGNRVVAPEDLMEGGDGRRIDAKASGFRSDPAGSPPGWSFRIRQISTSRSTSIWAGDWAGRRDRGSRPAAPSRSYRRLYS